MTTITTDSVELKKIIYDTVSIVLDEKLKNVVTKKDLSYLPTKVQFFKKMDKWMVAASTKELEGAAHKKRHDRAEKRLDKIESRLGIVSI